jgi:hypothetical protein
VVRQLPRAAREADPVHVYPFIEAGRRSSATRRQRPLSSRSLNTSVIIYVTDEYNEHPGVRKLSLDDTDRDRVINVLSLEYKTPRDEIGIRHTARFQLLGLMTAAAALIVTALLANLILQKTFGLALGSHQQYSFLACCASGC